MKKFHKFCVKNAFSLATITFLLVISVYLWHFHRQFISNDVEKWGVFGDFVGGTLNPLLSFLALIILLRTFSMQRKELSLQRTELKKTKMLLERQTETQFKQQWISRMFYF